MLKTCFNSEFTESDSDSVQTNFRIQFQISFQLFLAEFRLAVRIRIRSPNMYVCYLYKVYRHSGLEWPLGGGGLGTASFVLVKYCLMWHKNLENYKRRQCFRVPKDWKLGFYESQIAPENGVREVWKICNFSKKCNYKHCLLWHFT